ncbi:Por secretion system C-terminal sorting domain-containing protein [Lishizhenia tianjinensis]|uniref:Por secretion system C-terminal sorting domain-containing protein n=1 Tax=Lishizhenia tianjinensis TaxID=477690 RepID=A0A1I6ZKX8_9FLAO|nr:HYR domain-containing protein [Lishizhenia tianjinensis]SFT63275.1 Por secretion system C-terminal sorting domain-containing protein [Lishizhenia tianjinensis]
MNNEHRVKVNSLTFTENFAITSANVSNASCANNADGSIDVEVSYNKPCISYAWSNGATTQDVSGLLPGTYSLTITNPGAADITQTYTVGVEDITNPLAVAQDINVILDAAGNASIAAADVDGGSSDACGIAALAIDKSNFTCADQGANSVTLTVTDVNGNTSTASAIVTVIDSTAPAMATQDVTVYLDGSGSASITAADVDNGSTDACGVTLSVSPANFDCSATGNNTVTLTAIDASGNANTATATVTVIDSIAPAANTQDVTVYLDATGNASILGATSTQQVFNGNFANETQGFNLTSLTDWNVISGSVDIWSTFIPGSASGVSVDLSGNNNAHLESVQSVVFTPGSYTISFLHKNNSGSGEYQQNFSLSVGSLFNQTFTSTNATQTETINFTVTNTTTANVLLQQLGGNDASGCFIADLSIDKTIPASLMIDNGSNDNCGVASITASQTNFTCANIGANTVTLTVVDNSNNTASNTATVTVVDSTAPVAQAQDFVVALDANGLASISTADIDNGSSDVCGVTLALSQTNFTCADLGNNTVVLTVTDPSGNTSTATAVVTVEDNIAPTITCPANISYQAQPNDCSPSISWNAPQVWDNCSYTVTSSHQSGDNFEEGITTVSYTITDAAGNTATCSFDVEITTVPLSLNLNAATYVGGVNISCNGLTDGSIDATMDGGCLPYSYAWSDGQTTEDAANLGAGTYTLTVTDAKGRTISETVTLTEPEVLATSLVMSPDFPVAGQNQYTIYLGYGTQTVNLASTTTGGIQGYTYAWTNQDGVNVGNTASIDVSPMVPTNYTLLVTDANGCTTTASFFVDVIDARCGNNLNKVMVCHKESKTKKGVTTVEYHNICVSANAVPAHLAHGDYLGPCISAKMEAIEVVEEENIVLFPNPNNGSFSLFFTGEDHEVNAQVTIYSMDGRVIMTRTISSDELDHDVEFDFTNNSAGMYLLVVQQGDHVQTIKFSKN